MRRLTYLCFACVCLTFFAASGCGGDGSASAPTGDEVKDFLAANPQLAEEEAKRKAIEAEVEANAGNEEPLE